MHTFSKRRPHGESSLSFTSMARNLRRKTNKKRPKNVKTPKEIQGAFENQETMANFGLNLRKTDRFYINTVGKKKGAFTIFGSHEMIRLVEGHIPPEERKFMLDGTFDVVPVGCYYQLLIIAIEYKKDVSLMSNVF